MNTSNAVYTTDRDTHLTGFPFGIFKIIENFDDAKNDFTSAQQIIDLFGIKNPHEKSEIELNDALIKNYEFSKIHSIDSARLVYEIGYTCVAYRIYLDLLKLQKNEITVFPSDFVNEQKGFDCFISEYFQKICSYDDYEHYSETGNPEVAEWILESIRNCSKS